MKNKPTYEIIEEENKSVYDNLVQRELGYFKDVLGYDHMSIEDKLERFKTALNHMYHYGALHGYRYGRDQSFKERMELIDKLYPINKTK